MNRIIAALDKTSGIAKLGVQPWSIPKDEQYFIEKTKQYGGNILVGHHTYQLLHHPLVDRTMYVVSHRKLNDPSVITIDDVDHFLQTVHKNIWIIGGEQIYNQTLLQAEELYLTEIDYDFLCDQFFPQYKDAFHIVEASAWQYEKDVPYRFTIWAKNHT